MAKEIQPIFILPEGSRRDTGKNAQRNNIMAAKAVADVVRSTLGPKGMDKMLVDSLGGIVVTNDGVTILEEMSIQHPTAKMVVEIAKKTAMPYLYWNCDEPDIEQYLNRPSSSELKARIGGHELLIIDEAQRIRNIGITLKLITDTLKKVQLIVTGSSSIGLKDQISEPLTGRKLDFHLHPFCYGELADAFTELEENRLLSRD